MNARPLRDRLRLVAITDRQVCKMDYMRCVQELLDGGVTAIMFREKELPAGEQLRLLADVKWMCDKAGALLLVSHHLDVALESGAAGAHLGYRSIPVAEARTLAPHPFVLGYSAHSTSDFHTAAAAGADYCTLSPVFAPNSKRSTDKPLGFDALSAAARCSPLPIIALGGINSMNAASCLRAGAAGVAAIGALFGAADPRSAAQEFLACMKDS